jgi:hypothetical protein
MALASQVRRRLDLALAILSTARDSMWGESTCRSEPHCRGIYERRSPHKKLIGVVQKFNSEKIVSFFELRILFE